MGGGDKALLTIGGRTILSRLIDRLALSHIAISANGDPARFADFDLPVLSDGAFAMEGPLAGVLAGLTWAASIGADALLTVPGDTPFIPRGLAELLAPAPACVASQGRTHHLIALWPASVRNALRACLAEPGPRHVARFAESAGMREVDFPPSAWDPFINVNTAEDLAAARACHQVFGETA